MYIIIINSNYNKWFGKTKKFVNEMKELILDLRGDGGGGGVVLYGICGEQIHYNQRVY